MKYKRRRDTDNVIINNIINWNRNGQNISKINKKI
jgi:hypothetical protein